MKQMKKHLLQRDNLKQDKYHHLFKKMLTLISLLFIVYQVWSVTLSTMDPMHQMSIHLVFILMLSFGLYRSIPLIDGLFLILAISSGIYFSIHAERFATRIVGIDPLSNWDIFFGLILVVLSMEAARRTIGMPIIIIALLFLAYALFGHHLSGMWYHRGMSLTELLEQLAFSYNGLWGSPIAVAASFVFMFVLFGALLQTSGASEFFFRLSVSMAGRSRGGALKIAVLASAFSGMISGSPTANVVTTGSFTIPMSKKLGYSPKFAAAIEAIASTGGSLLPPIMGSSAFLMAAVTSIPYTSIIIAATLPALLFYVALLAVVHFEACRLNLPRMDKKYLLPLKTVIKQGWFHLIPVFVLTVILLSGASPSRAGLFGIITIIVIHLLRTGWKQHLNMLRKAIDVGIKAMIPISTACAVAGLVIAGIMTTGLGGKLNSMIIGFTEGQFGLTLIVIMVISIILGMGMPVAATYVLTAMVAAPTLINLGVSEMASHLFIVYFSVLSAITPPVAVASFAAAGIAGANPTKVGVEAVRLGLTSFIIPFAFVLNPALLMDGTVVEIGLGFIFSIIGVITIASGMTGYLNKKLHYGIRILLVGLGGVLLYPTLVIRLIALLLIGLIIYVQHGKNIMSFPVFRKL